MGIAEKKIVDECIYGDDGAKNDDSAAPDAVRDTSRDNVSRKGEMEKKIVEDLIMSHMQAINRILAENPDTEFEWPFRIVDIRYDPYKSEYIIDTYLITHRRETENRPQ